ncbi:hypothetical protein [Rahnella sp. NRRL B-41462]|uniref:hypothetical protein n=1 Tax=Rahnella sp. NRRL B-41462 TaxID=1610579 RepID=UPI000DD398D9|nr:hypothetical protein [Rahnella sp. NRRL B-41462]
MKERPILFNAEMVKAILSGRKTQTRRVMKPQPSSGVRKSVLVKSGTEDGHGREHVCPLGQPGDQLWVREAFATLACGSYEPEKPSLTGTYQEVRYLATDRLADCDADVRGYNWRPSIHMPRWASRIDLLITGVRVERLNDISNEDIRAEGAAQFGCTSHRVNFQTLWESIYGEGSWDANPWVWVIEFKRVAPAGE